jgi:hypothetical protein
MSCRRSSRESPCSSQGNSSERPDHIAQEATDLSCTQSLGALPEFTYRKVLLRGRWDHAHAMLLGPRVHDGTKGYHVIEPLVRTDGTTLLVDRGFISQEQAEALAYLKDDREVEVLGMLRTGHTRNNFTPDNKPEEGTWYWADIDAMTAFAGGEQAGVQPVYIEEIFGKSRLFYACPSSVLMTNVSQRGMLEKLQAGLRKEFLWVGHPRWTSGILMRRT